MLLDFFNLSTLFRIINFGALCTIIGFFFKRTFVPSIKKQIHDKKLLILSLEQQKQGIKNQLDNLERALEQQHYIAQELHKKIKQWNNFVAAEQEKENNEKKLLQQKIDQITTKRHQELLFLELYKGSLAQSIQSTEHNLTTYFEKDNNQKAYMHDILNFIQESIV